MRLVISGAGIAGLTLANRMSRLGAEVVLLERAPGPRPQGYMIDFFGPGYQAADAMGLIPAIRDIAYHFDEAAFVDENGRRRASVQPALFANGPLLSLMRPDLEHVLREHLPPEVDLRFGTGPGALRDLGDGIRVTLDDGDELQADLLVGTDGVHSTVRQLVFGSEPRFLRYLGFHTTAFTFDAPEIHAALRGRACLTDTVDRQMGFYGLRDGRVAVFGVHRTADPELPDDVRGAVRAAYAQLGWLVPEALDRCPPPSEIYYDQVAQIDVPRWSIGRVVLVGDACYAVSLLAAQGASLAMAGAYLLADRLAGAQSIEQGLAEYERMWRPVVAEKQQAGRSAAGWFLPSSALQLRLRRLMLHLSRVPVIDRYVAAAVAGKPSALITNLQRPGTTSMPAGTETPRGS